MSRQEATNVFNEGLIMDLNPLTTPNNVLTDCVNGTYITYNGNEFVLQNDQGNYKLQNCRLKENFVPIGIKEFAGILYIMSYNPLTAETEIGSYPSPRRISDTNDRNQIVEFTPIISEAEVSGDQKLMDTYESLSKKAKMQMYALSNNLENFKLNPGDEFKLGLNYESVFPYQNLKFSVMTEDKELFDINDLKDYAVPVDTVEASDWHKVFWEVPGWLTGKYVLANIDQFYLNFKDLNIPEFSDNPTFDVNLQLNSQIEISDTLFTTNSDLTSNLKIEYTFWSKNILTGTHSKLDGSPIPEIYLKNNEVTFTDENGNLVSTDPFEGSFDGRLSEDIIELNYTDLYKSYYNNYLGENGGMVFANRTKDELIYISAVPVLIVNNTKVYYEQFRTTSEINLSTVSESTQISIADNIFKHTVDDDGINITFNVQGPFVGNTKLELFADIYGLNESEKNLITTVEIADLNLYGQNTITIPFEGNFIAEDIYIICFRLSQSGTVFKFVNKILVASKTLNVFYDEVLDYNSSLSLSDWINKFKDYLDIQTSFTSKGITYSSEYGLTPTFEDINLFGGNWPTDWMPKTFSDVQNPIYHLGLLANGKYNITPILSTLKGNIWGNFDTNCGLQYSFNNGNLFTKTLDLNTQNDIDIDAKIYEEYTGNIVIDNKKSVFDFNYRYLKEHLGYRGPFNTSYLSSGYCDIECDMNVWYDGENGFRYDATNFWYYGKENWDITDRQSIHSVNGIKEYGIWYWFNSLNSGLPFLLAKANRQGSTTNLTSRVLAGTQEYFPGVYYIMLPVKTTTGSTYPLTMRTRNYLPDNEEFDANRFPLANNTDERDYLLSSIKQFCERAYFATNVVPVDRYKLTPQTLNLTSQSSSTLMSTSLQVDVQCYNFGYKGESYDTLESLVLNTLSIINQTQTGANNPPTIIVSGTTGSMIYNVNTQLPQILFTNSEELNVEINKLLPIINSKIAEYQSLSDKVYAVRTTSGVTSGGVYFDFEGDTNADLNNIKNEYREFIGHLASNIEGIPNQSKFYLDWTGASLTSGDAEFTREIRDGGTQHWGVAGASIGLFPGYTNVLTDYQSPFNIL